MPYDKDKRREKEQELIDEAHAAITANPHLRGYLASLPHPTDITGRRHSPEWNKLHYYEFVMERGSHSKKLNAARDIMKLPVARYKK